MLYLVDANVLITADSQYYPLGRVPEFWDWLLHMASQGTVKMPTEMIEEIKAGDDALAEWVSDREHLEALRLAEDVDVGLLQRVIAEGYAPDLDDTEIGRLGQDPFLISYALKDVSARRVVTTEVSKPTRQRANRHIPDVCNGFGVGWLNSFELVRTLNFSTNWRAQLAAKS
ncbi:DUF4411 family protein [uncultured Bosea sp.]|uniref:DUF4411 family protein n=1 Tax=uncultured Bosea sp. TaxID=211457 RepID=UPI0025F707EC|nr:DUF4411 family protein [uncultured Bosea sp.]